MRLPTGISISELVTKGADAPFEKVTLVFLVDVERFLVIFYLGNPKIKLKLTLAIIIKIIPKPKIKLATSR